MFRLIKDAPYQRLTVTAALGDSLIASALFMNSAFAQDSPSASAAPDKVVFTFADVSEPSSLNPMVATWAPTTRCGRSLRPPVNFINEDFSPDFAHSRSPASTRARTA